MPLTPEQKKYRLKGIGGSEIAAVAGLNPWAAPSDVWASKMGITEEMEVNENMERGIYLEDGILRWAGHRTGLDIQGCNVTFRCKEHQLVMATPDGLVYPNKSETLEYQPDAIAEVKAPGINALKDWADPEVMPDGIPTHYLPQVVWEMAATGYKEPAVVAAFIGGGLRVYRIPWDNTLEELFQLLVGKAEAFWGYVERQEPPPADGTMAAAKWIKKHYDTQRGVELVKVQPDHEKYMLLRDAAAQYVNVQRSLKQLEPAKANAQALLQEFIKDGAGLQGEDFKVTWKQNKKGRPNWKAIAEELGATPELIQKHIGNPPRRFLVKLEEKDNG